MTKRECIARAISAAAIAVGISLGAIATDARPQSGQAAQASDHQVNSPANLQELQQPVAGESPQQNSQQESQQASQQDQQDNSNQGSGAAAEQSGGTQQGESSDQQGGAAQQAPPAQQQAPQQNGADSSAQPAPPPPAHQPGQTSIEHEQKTGTSNDRLFWVLPNFLSMQSSYDTVPVLTTGQKFKVVGRSLIDPFEFVLIGFVAGFQQAANSTPSYGQGMSGYGLRYATSYGDNAIENFMASAVLPSLLHQDPRYYELGHGGFWRRTEHALSRLVITRTDSGGEQFNYSEVFGAGIAATISTYTYHPQADRGFSNVVTVWGSQMGYDLGTYMLKEFWPELRKRGHKRAKDTSSTDTTK